MHDTAVDSACDGRVACMGGCMDAWTNGWIECIEASLAAEVAAKPRMQLRDAAMMIPRRFKFSEIDNN